MTADAAVELRSYAGEPLSHRHAWRQIVLPLAGRLALDVGGREGFVHRACGAVIARDATHAFATNGANRFLVIDVDDAAEGGVDAAEAWLDRAGRRVFFHVDPIVAETARVAALNTRGQPGARAAVPFAPHWARLLVLTMAERAGERHALDRCRERLDAAIALVERAPLRAWTIGEMARAAGLSPSHFHALFRRTFGSTPREHVTARRLDAAYALVASTDIALADVALRAGYADQTTFTRAFRRRFGAAPGAIRRAESRSKES